ncbi:hypothetical protein TrLO_g10157 [Triparma laevis f. longispina]|uniref:Uncharacterized protein n=1 Tax=Triparma laevis f. longispina TaxID=1714387 RepID=A0A9W7FAY9_9STRA|nr:hypothetical protein TrLO_g10157 [Triparma laevis f. longispina]
MDPAFPGGNGAKGMGVVTRTKSCPGNGPHRNESWQTHGRSIQPAGVNGWHRELNNSSQSTISQKGASVRAMVSSASTQFYDVQLKRLLAEYAPDKLCQAPQLLVKWKGREETLIAKIREKFQRRLT